MPWSFSALNSWETCPKKHYHLSIARDIKDKGNEAASYGTDVHKAFELFVKNGKRLPLDLKHHQPFLDKLVQGDAECLPEQKLALNKDFQATGFFDNDVWLRGIIDFTKIMNDSILVVDYKTGKMQEGFDQVQLQAAMMMAILPEVEKAVAAFYWTKSKKLTRTQMTRDDCQEVWSKFLPRVENMETMIAKEEFPARQNGLCRNYCPVKTCKFNGG